MRRAALLPVLTVVLAPAAPPARDTPSIAEMACRAPTPPPANPAGAATTDDIVVSSSQKDRNPERIVYAVPCGTQRIARLYFSRNSGRHGWGINRFVNVQTDRWQKREYAAIHLDDPGRGCSYDERVIMVDADRKEHEYISTFNICRWNILVMHDVD